MASEPSLEELRRSMPKEQTFAEWREKMEFSVDFMKNQIKKKTDHDMTSEEAFAYLAWTSQIGIDRMLFVSARESKNIFQQILSGVATDCMDRYRAALTGQYGPPRGPRFENPEAFEFWAKTARGGDVRNEVPPENVKQAYTPGGYL